MKNCYRFCVSIVATGMMVLQASAQDTQRPSPSDSGEVCFSAMVADARVKLLATRMPLDFFDKQPSLDMLTSKAKPNAKEKVALNFIYAELERCGAIFDTSAKQADDRIIVELSKPYRTELRALMVDLYAGTMTYGDLAKSRMQLDNRYKEQRKAQADAAAKERAAAEQARMAAEKQAREEAEQKAQIAAAEAKAQEERARQPKLERATLEADYRSRQQDVQQQRAERQQGVNDFLQALINFRGPPEKSSGLTCFRKREWTSGFNKNCVYSCLGSERVQTFESTDLCPLTIQQP